MDMKTRVRWIEGVAFAGESGSGHVVVVDGAPDGGGRNIGMRPMEMLLTGAAACTAYDVVTILRKGRHPVADVAVTVEAERAPAPPRVFTRLHYVYTGNIEDPDGQTTYCPNCKSPVIRRDRYTIDSYDLDAEGRCRVCGTQIPGRFGGSSVVDQSFRLPHRVAIR